MPPPPQPDRIIDIYFRRNGLIDINSSVVRALDIRRGDSIGIIASDTGERYLYVSRRAAESTNPSARYRNAVREAKRSRVNGRSVHTLRCNSVSLTSLINGLTHSVESWLYVGTPRDLSDLGINAVGLPLIWSNNQYHP